MKKNRRRGSRRWVTVARRSARVILSVLGIVVAALVGRTAVGWVEAHPYFAVREIDIEAPRGRLDAKTIVAWAGLTPGMSIWRVSEPRAAERLLTHPRIRAATVERRLPGQVTLRVEERRPVAVLLGSQPLLVAADGVVFRPGEGEGMADLPYVTGLAGEDPFSAASTERLRRAAHVVDLWQAQTHLPPISEVRSESDQLIVFTVGTPLAVRFGLRASTDDLVRLSTLLDLWRGREAQMSTIDLSLPGEAVVGLRGGKRPSHGRSSTT